MSWPSLSVIIPSYNQGAYIERTLLSVLRQGYPGALEVIVSDGGSTDGTVGVLQRYPQVRWWSEEDRGFADAVNKGLAVATGEVVAIQSSDDFYLEGAFAKAISALMEDDGLALVTGNDVHIGEDGRLDFHPAKPYVTMLSPGALIARDLVLYVPQHCTFVRRSAVDRVGGLREEVDYCADFDLWYRVLHFGRGLMLPDYLAVYQVHPAQRTQSKADLFIRVHKQVVEDAESDPVYAERFVPTPDMKRNKFRQWEVGWNGVSGGEEGAWKARALARQTLQEPDVWPDYVLNTVRPYAAEPSAPVPPSRARHLAQRLRLTVKHNRAVRAAFGKPPYPRHGFGPNKEVLDIDWWKPKERPPVKAAAVLLVGALALGALAARRVANAKNAKTNSPSALADAMSWPSLSVIIPSYNQGAYIERTLLSVLRQGYPGALEVIVSDGGSTDGTVGVLQRYPQVRWWSEKDRGFVDAVNKGLAVATGEVVAIQSSDDFYLEGAFVRAIAALRDDPSLALVTGNDALIGEDGPPYFQSTKPSVTMLNPGALIGRTPNHLIPQHCTFVRRSAVDRVGGLREEVDYCADFDLWYRVLHFGRGLMLPDYLAVYQVHPAQRTAGKAELWLKLLRKTVEDAESDPVYAERFVPTPDMKRNIFRQWEISWNKGAGGEAGARKARALARQTLQEPDAWPDYVRDYIEEFSHDPPPEPAPPSRVRRLADGLRQTLRRNPALRAVLGKPKSTRYGVRSAPDGQVVDSGWWMRKDRALESGTPLREAAAK